MYEERKDNFSIKGFILQLLIILLFVFLMLWLFPTKNYIDEKLGGLQSEQDLKQLEVLYGEIFANNVERMKDAAKGYYTDERLPQSIGQTYKMTLGEMYDKHLVLEMSAVDGKTCSTTDSYVEITKYKNEYQMKVNLKCGDKEDYIIVYMGCYTYCKSGICEKQVTSTSSGKETQIETKTPSNPTPSDPTPTKNYMYEYKLVTDGTTTCTGWTEWTKNKITESSTVKVESKTESVKTGTKTEQYISGYKTQKVQTGTKTEKVQTGTAVEKVKTGTTTEKYIASYTTEKVVVDTKLVQTGTTTKTITEKVQTGTTKVYVKSDSGTTIPSNTSTYVYVKTGSTTKKACSTCSNVTTYYWDVYKIVPVYKAVTRTETVPVYKVEYIYETKQIPVYKTRTVDVYTTKEVPVYSVKTVPVYTDKKVPIYSTKEIPVYSNVTYYRSKTCTYKSGGTYYKWSTNKNDTNLIKQGYKLTGNVKQI